MPNTSKLGLRRALDAFFFGFGQAFNLSGAAVDRGRFGRGFAGDAQALAGDWARALQRADEVVRSSVQARAGVKRR